MAVSFFLGLHSCQSFTRVRGGSDFLLLTIPQSVSLRPAHSSVNTAGIADPSLDVVGAPCSDSICTHHTPLTYSFLQHVGCQKDQVDRSVR